jgi:hypothetical protein
MIDDECAAIGGMQIGRGNRSTRRKPAPASHCPPQILHNLTWDRTRAAAVGRQRLSALANNRLTLKCFSLYMGTQRTILDWWHECRYLLVHVQSEILIAWCRFINIGTGRYKLRTVDSNKRPGATQDSHTTLIISEEKIKENEWNRHVREMKC